MIYMFSKRTCASTVGRQRAFVAGLLVVTGCIATGCSAVPAGTSSWLPSWGDGFTSTAAAPGTKDWWRKNKNKAELVPGQGWRVEGVPGFFDDNGRPMEAPLSEEALVLSEDDKVSKGLLPGLDPKRNYNRAKVAVGLGPNRERARQSYLKAQELYAAGSYRRAASEFAEAAGRAPNSTIEQQALLGEANSYFYNDNYIDARDKYVKLMEKYPNSGHVDEAVERLWAIAQYWEKHHESSPHWPVTPNVSDKTRPWFDTLGHAIKTYENIQMYDPTGPRADDAIMAMAGTYFRTDRYNDADHYYKLLRQQYPRSEFQFEAHLLGLQSKLRKYQGPAYDGTTLTEAEKLAEKLRTQFAGRLTAEERERLAQTQAEVARAGAERDMHMAQHYEKTEHYGSARVYYAEVVKKYPESQLATEARTRLAQISSEADVPEERLGWLIDMFPENPERTRVARVPELREPAKGETQSRLAAEAGQSERK